MQVEKYRPQLAQSIKFIDKGTMYRLIKETSGWAYNKELMHRVSLIAQVKKHMKGQMVDRLKEIGRDQ